VEVGRGSGGVVVGGGCWSVLFGGHEMVVERTQWSLSRATSDKYISSSDVMWVPYRCDFSGEESDV
jgi:hypothetical protein